MKQEIPYEIIARFLSGEATEQERLELDEWTLASDENMQIFEQMQDVWMQTAPVEFEPNTEKALKRVSEKVGHKKTILRPSKRWMQIAAVAAVLIGIGLYFTLTFHPEKNQTVTTIANQTQSVILEDGTTVILNENSSLTYPEHFSDTVRSVTLIGEAYFDVHKNPQKPFIILAENTQIRVLGTAFIINARPQSAIVTVNVHRGKVAFSQNNNKVILTIGEKGTFDKKTGIVSESINDNLNDMAWSTNILTFISTPMPKVVEQISTYFKTSISIENKNLDTIKFTSQFNNKPLPEVLKIIELTTGHSFIKDNAGYHLK